MSRRGSSSGCGSRSVLGCVANILHDLKNELSAARQAARTTGGSRTAELRRPADTSAHLDEAKAMAIRVGRRGHVRRRHDHFRLSTRCLPAVGCTRDCPPRSAGGTHEHPTQSSAASPPSRCMSARHTTRDIDILGQACTGEDTKSSDESRRSPRPKSMTVPRSTAQASGKRMVADENLCTRLQSRNPLPVRDSEHR